MPIQVITSQGQVKGTSAVVATTVAGLGTAVEGKQGLIRVGSTPYDHVALTYDGTYGKWVSGTTDAAYLGTIRTVSTGAVDLKIWQNTGGYTLGTNWTNLNAAGLSPQIRLLCTASDESGGNAITFQASTASANDGAAMSAFTAAWTSASVTLTTAGGHYSKKSDWVAVPGGTSVADILYVKGLFNKASGTNFVVAEMSAELRWVG